MDMIGFGTKSETKLGIIKNAIDLGYKFFDCKNSNVSLSSFKNLSFVRNSISICSKLTGEDNPENHNPKNVRNECIKSLQKAGLTYWDIYYIHTAHAFNNHPLLETYNKLLELKDEKLCLNVGLSNITFEQLESIVINSKAPDYIQIEIHPYLTEERIVNFCKKNNIKVVAHSPFGSSLWKEISNDTTLIELSKKYNCTVTQLLLSWHISRSVIPIPSSNNKTHMETNLKHITISNDDINRINTLNRNKRVWIKPNHYESIGKPCRPLPKRKIIMSDILNENTLKASIINDIVLKGFHICQTTIDPDLHSLCSKLKNEETVDINAIKNNNLIQSISKTYYGKTLKICEVRKNTPHKNLRPYFTQLFHRDTQLQKCLKIIIYLSDVSEENGPLQIVYPEPDVNLRWYKDERNARAHPEDILQKIPQENILSITGPAHTMIIFEGTVLHCGGFIKSGFRKVIYLE